MKKTLKHGAKLQEKTSTFQSPYFGGSLSSFLTRSITDNVGIDNSIAYKNILYNIDTNKWSKCALSLFGAPESYLPPIVPGKHNHGTIFNSNIELKIVLGDQQAGHNGLKQNTLAANYGTSGSIQVDIGETFFDPKKI